MEKGGLERKEESLAELGEFGDVLDKKDAADAFFSKFGGEPVRIIYLLSFMSL